MTEVKPCGTYAAYQRHLRNHEVPCDACAQAQRDYRAAQRAARPKKVRPPAPCGTYAAYQRHLKHGEEIDEDCRVANNEYHKQMRERVPGYTDRAHQRSRVRHRAIRRLIELHPVDFAILEEDEWRIERETDANQG